MKEVRNGNSSQLAAWEKDGISIFGVKAGKAIYGCL
jgi:hypothetical protein